jgi:hypothetical protein
MRTQLIASTAAVLLSASFAAADNPLIPNDNDNMAARSFIIEQSRQARTGLYGAPIVTYTGRGAVTTGTFAAPQVAPGFLLHGSNDGHKQVENQYAR